MFVKALINASLICLLGYGCLFGSQTGAYAVENKLVGDASKASRTRTKISNARPDGKGFLVHEVESEFQAGKTQIRVLLPDNLEKDRRYPVVYVLPVEPQNEYRFGDGLAEFKKINAHNKYKIICVAPTFCDWPWYCDHPTDPTIRQESYLTKAVVPMIERTYSTIPNRQGRLLLGFSKSGRGAYSLLLRNPDVFGRAVAWDAPVMGRGLMNCDAAPHLGHEGKFRTLPYYFAP